MNTKTIYTIRYYNKAFESFADAVCHVSGLMDGNAFDEKKYDLLGDRTQDDADAIKWTFKEIDNSFEVDVVKTTLTLGS